ncbi:MAG: N-6 DNA methylase [Succinivibrionaceae bacterium]
MIEKSVEYIGLNELCALLNISLATGKNWYRLGKLDIFCVNKIKDDKDPLFLKKEVSEYMDILEKRNRSILKKGRNKNFVKGSSIYSDYIDKDCCNIDLLQDLISFVDKIDINVNNKNYYLIIIAEYALRLLMQRLNLAIFVSLSDSLLIEFVNKKISIGEYDILISNLIENFSKKEIINFIHEQHDLFSIVYQLDNNLNNDILGFLYISLKNNSDRKSNGIYYTPNAIVNKLISQIGFSTKTLKVLDPCCGTGNFLMKLPQSISLSSIYAYDIDKISIDITRINLVLKYGKANLEKLCAQIVVKDFLHCNDNSFKYDLIIGNPPWGSLYSDTEKRELKKIYSTIEGQNVESASLFIEQSINNLKSNGLLYFVLPESLLTVNIHRNIRKLIIDKCCINKIIYLGDRIFTNVYCPSVILGLKNKEKFLTKGIDIELFYKKNTKFITCDTFKILEEREISDKFYSFNFRITNIDYYLLSKIEKQVVCEKLENQCDFSLGIVTGDNEKFLKKEKLSDNYRPILSGMDIYKYGVKNTYGYIEYIPKNFQQVPKVDLYNVPEKLIYKFISSKLIFAYDNEQFLTLNSCNVIVPKIKNLSLKYILAILNSSVAQFYTQVKYNSLKVLRTHIESIPIAICSNTLIGQIENYVDKLINFDKNSDIGQYNKLLYDLDNIIFDLYKIDQEDRDYILNKIKK